MLKSESSEDNVGGGGGGDGGDGRAGLLAAIRTQGGNGLRKVAARSPTQGKSAHGGDPRNALLGEIQMGRQLRKIVVEKKAAPVPTTLGGLNVAAILARRAALDDDDDDESDDDEWDD